MPFQSKAQAKKCFAMTARGQAGGWDCEEWADKTNYSKLPEKKSSSTRSKSADLDPAMLGGLAGGSLGSFAGGGGSYRTPALFAGIHGARAPEGHLAEGAVRGGVHGLTLPAGVLGGGLLGGFGGHLLSKYLQSKGIVSPEWGGELSLGLMGGGAGLGGVGGGMGMHALMERIMGKPSWEREKKDKGNREKKSNGPGCSSGMMPGKPMAKSKAKKVVANPLQKTANYLAAYLVGMAKQADDCSAGRVLKLADGISRWRDIDAAICWAYPEKNAAERRDLQFKIARSFLQRFASLRKRSNDSVMANAAPSATGGGMGGMGGLGGSASIPMAPSMSSTTPMNMMGTTGT